MEVMGKFVASVVMMVSWTYNYVQTHQAVCSKSLQLFVCQSYLNFKKVPVLKVILDNICKEFSTEFST